MAHHDVNAARREQRTKRLSGAPYFIGPAQPHLAEHGWRHPRGSEPFGNIAFEAQCDRHLHARREATATRKRQQERLDAAEEIAAVDVEDLHAFGRSPARLS
jgi:hypothetical protein